MYSALKVNGKKLYELARAGIEVERKARPVIIYEIRIKEISLPRVRMEVSCSKGTYIRTLCHDIGEKLGCGGCMEELTRTKDVYKRQEVPEKKKGAVGVRGIKLQKKDELEQVYLLEEGVEQKVLYKEKEVTLNRLKLARRDGIGTKR